MTCFLQLAAIALVAWGMVGQAQAERMIELFRQGYRVFHTEGYLDYEGCEYDKTYKVGPYVFVCRTYSYSYHYGKAELMVREIECQGRRIYSTYLCFDEEDCVQGDLRRVAPVN